MLPILTLFTLSAYADFPPIPQKPLTGSILYKQLDPTSSDQRETQIKSLYLNGQFPESLRHLHLVRSSALIQGNIIEAEFFVTPDYLAIGTNKDYVRTPITNKTAQEIADQFSMTLPTSRMVDLIYFGADYKLDGDPFDVTDEQRISTPMFLASDEKINARLLAAGGGSEMSRALVAGHKKDVVLGPPRGKLRIYGWADSSIKRELGRMPYIQPEASSHRASYVDYSHGIRLVSNWIYLHSKNSLGKSSRQVMLISKVLGDPILCPLLSYRCPLTGNQTKAYVPTEVELD